MTKNTLKTMLIMAGNLNRACLQANIPLLIITLAAIIGFSMTGLSLTGCDLDDSNNDQTYSLNGVWENNGGAQVTVSRNSGILNTFGSLNSLGQDAVNKGYWKLNDQEWRNLTSTGNLTWSGQRMGITYNSSSPNVATGITWVNCTITMSANGQTVDVTAAFSSGSSTTTWTRSSYKLNGVWENNSGAQVTVSGNSGILNSFGNLNSLGQDAVNKSYWKLNDQEWRNLTSTGNLTWSGQRMGITYNSSSPNVATGITWVNCTITMSANGQTLDVIAAFSSGSSTTTWTRRR